jgi:hypothetical protein
LGAIGSPLFSWEELLLGLRIQRAKNFTLNLDITGFARLHDSIGIIFANKYLNLEDKV